jgi:hypothetical protein
MEMLAVSAASITDVVNQQVRYRFPDLLGLAKEAAKSVSNLNKLIACGRLIIEEV